jgi:hypothetical protein
MGKALKTRTLISLRTARALLAVSLTASLAVAGCTTNRNLGDGQPARSDPAVRVTPTSGVTSGSEHPPTVPPSMTSSYSGTGSTYYVRADQVAGMMARIEATPPVRVLGPSDPAEFPAPSYSAALPYGQLPNPSLLTNPQITINSSISSPPTPLVGVADPIGGIADVETFLGAVAAEGVRFPDAGLIAGGSGGAAVTSAPAGVVLTPTTAAIGVPVGSFAGATGIATAPAGTMPVTAASGMTPSPTALSGQLPPLTMISSSGPIPASSGLNAASSQSAQSTGRAQAPASAPTSATTTLPVRLVRAADGRLLLTNSR